MAEYVNKQVIEFNKVTEETRNRATRSVKTETHLSDGRLYRLAAVCFGVLCVLQVTLNISLRLAFCTGRGVEGRGMAVPTMTTVLKCPKGWRMLGSSCYFLSTERKTWEESRQYCLNRGADLVIINSRQEQFLFNRNNGFWIGLTDTVTEGTWKWVDGNPLTTPRSWGIGQPNGGGMENCVLLIHSSSDQGTWHDYPCSSNRPWICEIVLSHF
eukprot:XP_014065303.1 PREDICTED: C-type lectin domain family 4 member E-like [Salmo salar]